MNEEKETLQDVMSNVKVLKEELLQLVAKYESKYNGVCVCTMN